MRDAFQEAFRAVEKIWDYENRTIPDGVTIDDIQRAESAVEAVDITLLSATDSDMLALLQESVREACRIFEERERNADSGVDGTQEPVLDMDHELAVAEEEIDTADPEDEYGDALGREGLERYNQEVWDKLEEKKELQRKRTEEKKRTDRWLRRLRAKQETEREAKAKREAEAKAVEERNEAEKNRADERARIIARYQKKQRIYESKKEREDYRRETTRKHMAEREELRARAEDRIREQERKRQEANRERVREARAEKAPGHHSHGALSDEKVKNGRKQDQVLASMAAVGQIPEQRVFTERKVLDQDSSGSNSYETEEPDGSFHHENEEKREAGNPSMDEQNNVFYDPERQVAGSGHIQRNSKRQEENHSFDQFEDGEREKLVPQTANREEIGRPPVVEKTYREDYRGDNLQLVTGDRSRENRAGILTGNRLEYPSSSDKARSFEDGQQVHNDQTGKSGQIYRTDQMPSFQQTLYGREINGSSSSGTDLPDGENGYGKTAASHVDATSLTGGAVADDQKERIREEYEIRKAEESARNMENTQKLQQAAEESRKGAERFREEHFGPEKVKGDYGFRQISQRGYEGSGIKNSSDPYNPQYRHKYRTTETTKQGTGYFSGFASGVSQTQDSSKRTGQETIHKETVYSADLDWDSGQKEDRRRDSPGSRFGNLGGVLDSGSRFDRSGRTLDSGNRLGETGKNIDFSSGFKGAGRNSEFERNEAGYSNPKSGNLEKEYDHSSLDMGLHKNPQNDGNDSATPQGGSCGRTDVERYEEMVQKSGSSVSRSDSVSGREQGQKSFGAFRGTEYKNVWRSETGKTGDRSTDPGSGVKNSADSLRFGAGERSRISAASEADRHDHDNSSFGYVATQISDSFYEQDKRDWIEKDSEADAVERKSEKLIRFRRMEREKRSGETKEETISGRECIEIGYRQDKLRSHGRTGISPVKKRTGADSIHTSLSGKCSGRDRAEQEPAGFEGIHIRTAASGREGKMPDDVRHYETMARRTAGRKGISPGYGSNYSKEIRSGYQRPGNNREQRIAVCVGSGKDVPGSRGGIVYHKPPKEGNRGGKAMRIFLTPIGGFSYMAERVKNRIWRDTKLETAQELLERGLAEDRRGKDNCINVRRSTFDRVTGDYVRMESGGEKRIIKRTGRKTAEKSFLTSAVPVMEESFIPEPGGGNTAKWRSGRRQEPGKKGLRKQTPFERYVGQTFAVKTGLKFTDSASVRFKRIGRNAAVLPASLLNRTEAGRGMQKVNKTIRYATGAVAAAGAAGSLVSATAILAGSAGNIASYGIRYLKGIDGPKASMMSVQSAVEEKIGVVKGAHAISFSEKNISRRMKELKRKYPSTRGLDGTMMPGLVERFVIVREVRGKRIESIDLKLLNSNIREIKSAARNGSATKEMLLNLEGMKELKVIVRSRTFRANMGRFMRRSGSALNAAGAVVTAMIGSSDNPSMRGLVTAHQALCVMRSFAKMVVRTGKTGSVAGKLLLETKPVRAVGRKAKRAGQRAGRQAGEVLLRFVGTDYNTIHAAKTKYIGRLRSELNGGIYSRVSGTGIGKVTHRLGEGAGAAIRKASKPLHPVKRAASRITNGLKRTARIVSKPVRLFGAVMSKLTSGVRMLMKWAAVIFGIICLALFLFMIIGTFFIGFTQMIDTDTENLQNYVDYISEQNREWFEGKLEDSTADVSGVRMSLNEVYDKGGNQKGKYRIVTTNFVDQYGRKVDSSDNIKEILAMVSVKTINTWPDNWDLVDLPWGADKWTVNEVKDMIRHLYAASHSWSAAEKGPYIYYKELNKKDARLLKPYAASEYRHVYYPSDYQTKTLLGDAEGEACEGPRNFFCTEDSIPDSASEYRKEMDASYCARGGCEVDYSGYGTYDAATDTFVLDGRLHDGTKELGNASTQAWANTDIRTRREKAQQYENAKCSGSPVPVSGDDAAYVIAGSGDELMPAHGLDFHSRVARNRKTAPSGWIHYDRKFSKYAHGDSSGYMGNAPHASCTGYRRVYEGTVHGTTVGYYDTGCTQCRITNEYGIGIRSGTAYDEVMTSYAGSNWAEFVWDEEWQKYKSAETFGGNYVYVIDDGYTYHARTGNNTLWFLYNAQFDCWVPNAGKNTYSCTEPKYGYYCTEKLYNFTCHDYEAYCEGHRERATIYYCPGHEEYWCDGDHYDLDIEIRVHHIPELYDTDVNNEYSYKRKAVAVSEYPEEFDKLGEDGDDDFYWDRENREQAAIMARSKWTELYDGISGVDDVDVELDEEMLAKYTEYVDCPRIAYWKEGKPYGYDGNLIEISSQGGKWFYDVSRGQYVKIAVQKFLWRRDARVYTVQETSSVSPSSVSEPRRKLVLNALSCVGVIPYQEDGEPGSHMDISDFGWTETDDGSRETACGLNSGGFVNFIFRLSGHTIGGGNTGQIVKIWENTDEIGNRSNVTDKDLRPGDLGFINSYDDRLNPMVEQTEADIIPYNTVGIYMGTNELGQRVWIQCSKTARTVTVATTNNYNYFRRPKGID